MENKKYNSNEYKNKINKLNRFIVDLEFDNRQLRMEILFLYTKLSQKPPTAEDYEVPF
ncbi:hypothetical protein LGK97_19425 [Clostridium sp. CS001]|uniref:hypothetical protein n=1 Tax=Clostridium sp. CS001 TaxID=2880648 RepID=UPI001CF2E32E|nr:hypothetical protein [Clostridium sp. CS001]MCB2291875.1 hypothetical protein [Clostridium sp. CS001]